MLDNKQIPPLWPTWPIPPGTPLWGWVPLWSPIPSGNIPPQSQAVPQIPPTNTQQIPKSIPTSSTPVVSQAPQQKSTNSVNIGENILKELSGELDFGKKKASPNKKKNSLFYIQFAVTSFFWIQLLLVIGSFVALGYVYVQKNPQYVNTNFLDPICTLILGPQLSEKNTALGHQFCSSLAGLNESYQSNTTQLKKQLIDEIDNFFTEDYKIENFGASSEITFLTNNKINRLQILNILNDFDRVKNTFSGKNKFNVQCADLRITDKYILQAKCTFVGGVWIPEIIGQKGDLNERTQGTTISYAMSFLNFIEQHPEYRFKILEYPSTLTIDDSWVGQKETDVEFKLQYSPFRISLDK